MPGWAQLLSGVVVLAALDLVCRVVARRDATKAAARRRAQRARPITEERP
jgi:hypothetical protein